MTMLIDNRHPDLS